MLGDVLLLLAVPFAAALLFVGMHTWLGLQVLRRGVVFADLSLAQLSALGAMLAVAAGHAPGSSASFVCALALTAAGAVALTVLRTQAAQLSQEAVIGILYVTAAAATVLVVDRSPQGAEHVKRMLVGSILTIDAAGLRQLLGLYGAVAVLHALCRRPLLAAAGDGPVPGRWPRAAWDLIFYSSLGLVVTSSVAQAGVLLVFSFLIVPAVIGNLYRPTRPAAALVVGWLSGAVACTVGFGASVAWDLPPGAAVVVAFALVLLFAAAMRPLMGAPPALRALRWAEAARALAGSIALILAAQGAWLIAVPAADQPLLALLEHATGIGPEPFLTSTERGVYADAGAAAERYRAAVDRLRGDERDARWQGAGLGDEQVRRIGSFQQTFNEMASGERFVRQHLRAQARLRARWWVGLPLLALGPLTLLARRRRWKRAPRAPA